MAVGFLPCMQEVGYTDAFERLNVLTETIVCQSLLPVPHDAEATFKKLMTIHSAEIPTVQLPFLQYMPRNMTSAGPEN